MGRSSNLGAVLIAVGLILFYQNATRHWESWAYAWALIPAAVGAAQIVRGTLSGDRHEVRRGLSGATFFLVLFALGFSFFEGVLRIGGLELGYLGQYALPVLLILVGVWMLVARTLRVSLD